MWFTGDARDWLLMYIQRQTGRENHQLLNEMWREQEVTHKHTITLYLHTLYSLHTALLSSF